MIRELSKKEINYMSGLVMKSADEKTVLMGIGGGAGTVRRIEIDHLLSSPDSTENG